MPTGENALDLIAHGESRPGAIALPHEQFVVGVPAATESIVF